MAPVRGTNHFKEWMRILPFQGQIDGGSYIFPAADGHTDTVKAVYQPDPITLPFTSREGWSFGGWYYETSFTQPAGAAGGRGAPGGRSGGQDHPLRLTDIVCSLGDIAATIDGQLQSQRGKRGGRSDMVAGGSKRQIVSSVSETGEWCLDQSEYDRRYQ